MNDIPEELKNKIGKYCDFEKASGVILKTTQLFNIKNIDSEDLRYVFNLEKVNNIRRINKFHKQINRKLDIGDIYLSCAETLENRRVRVRSKTLIGFKNIIADL